jgi:GntR family transcriptional repressor for pyruvate dehydrogenase complex
MTEKRKKNYEWVAEQILEKIQKGEIKSGDKLESVEQLAIHYKVSRSAIREALSALKAMGYLDIRQGEGTFVKDGEFSQFSYLIDTPLSDTKMMLQFFEMRKIIESGTVSLAAARRTEQDLQHIRTALEDMKQAHGNEIRCDQADVKFHLAIAHASKNQLLVRLMNQISDTLYSTIGESRRLWLFAEKATVDRLYQEHEAIYNAILDQNPSLAEQLMLSHLSKVEKALEGKITR